MDKGSALCVLAGLLWPACQVVGCSDAVRSAREPLGRLDIQEHWTVLVHQADHLGLLDVTDGKVTPITAVNSSADTSSPGMASFSPDGSEITFKQETGGGDSLVVLNLKNGTRRSLLKMAYLDAPRWAPDGAGIAFEGRSEVSGDYSLYFYNLKDGKLSTLLEKQLKGGEMLFSWAPDAKRIAFQSTANDIYVLDLATRQLTRIDSGWFPTWSPNSRHIAYRADVADDPGYILYDLETRERKRLLRGRSVYRSLIWSPDSRYLVYSADGRGEYYGDLLILDLKTEKETLVLRLEESIYPTDWTRSSQLSLPRP